MREPNVPGRFPRDWSEAFAALPPEAPPADALSSVFAQIPASASTRSHRRWWIAAAAALALIAVVPFTMNVVRHPHVAADSRMTVQGQPRDTAIAPARHSGESRNPALAANSGIQKLGPGLRRDDGAESVFRSEAATPVTTLDRKTLDARLRGHDEQKQIAKADRPHREPHRTRKPAPIADPSGKAMESLYAESARLEALLALARDDRVSSATALALGSDFDARIAAIDAALMQPSLPAQRRLDLWRERVSALRAYASFESTQRALAANGERYDAMLVSID